MDQRRRYGTASKYGEHVELLRGSSFVITNWGVATHLYDYNGKDFDVNNWTTCDGLTIQRENVRIHFDLAECVALRDALEEILNDLHPIHRGRMIP